jgi:hypothetical protein
MIAGDRPDASLPSTFQSPTPRRRSGENRRHNDAKFFLKGKCRGVRPDLGDGYRRAYDVAGAQMPNTENTILALRVLDL